MARSPPSESPTDRMRAGWAGDGWGNTPARAEAVGEVPADGADTALGVGRTPGSPGIGETGRPCAPNAPGFVHRPGRTSRGSSSGRPVRGSFVEIAMSEPEVDEG